MRGTAIETAARIGGAAGDPAIEAGVDGLLAELGRPRRAPRLLRVSGDRIAEEELAEAELQQATQAAARPAPFALRIVQPD